MRDPMERLAREICWIGFGSSDARKGKTRARYWKDITEDARQNYRAEARQFVFILTRLDDELLNSLPQ